MSRTHLAEDIQPLSEFRANAAALIDRVRDKGRALVLTQRGHSAAVVLGVDEYQKLLDEVETLRDISKATKQLDAGKGISHDVAKRRLLRRFRNR